MTNTTTTESLSMKKQLFFYLALTIVVLSLSSCGKRRPTVPIDFSNAVELTIYDTDYYNKDLSLEKVTSYSFDESEVKIFFSDYESIETGIFEFGPRLGKLKFNDGVILNVKIDARGERIVIPRNQTTILLKGNALKKYEECSLKAFEEVFFPARKLKRAKEQMDD